MDIQNLKTKTEFESFLEQCIGYLEKANGKDLGDLTPEGKIRNAGSANYTLYWQWYKEQFGLNYQAQAYCAGWVSIMLTLAFGKEQAQKLLCGSPFVYCPDGYNQFKRYGRIHTTPEIFDVAFFWSNNLNRWGHVGWVIKVLKDDKGHITGYVTIEANTTSTQNTVVRNGGTTARKSYSLDDRKVAFGRPDWAGCGILDGSKPSLEVYAVATGEVGLRVLADINVRINPGTTSNILGTIKAGSIVRPSQKAFDQRGVRWFYIDELQGWISGNFVQGWIYEYGNERWWYALPNGNWYSHTVKEVDGCIYAFDDAGYMITDPITLYPNKIGALELPRK